MRPPAPVGRTRRRSTPSWRARRRTAGPAAAEAWPSPGTSSTASSGGAGFLGFGLRGLRRRVLRLFVFRLRLRASASWAALWPASSSSSARRRSRHRLLRSLFGFFRLRARFRLLGGALAFSSFGGFGFFLAGFSSALGRFDLHDRRADFDRVAFLTRILVILPACGRGSASWPCRSRLRADPDRLSRRRLR